MDQLIQDFEEKTKITAEDKASKAKARREERTEKRKKGEEDISSDTDDDYALREMTEEAKAEFKKK